MRRIQRLLAFLCVFALWDTNVHAQEQSATPGTSAATPVAATKPPATFFFVHWQYFSLKEPKNRAMQRIVDEWQESLRAKGVRFVSDPLRPTSHSK
ncbi:MAG TPA: hypothetical protein VMS96_14630, partial [Terriglobales bacterium]|nr:hypothetical protein [Terriglobales bacterium]